MDVCGPAWRSRQSLRLRLHSRSPLTFVSAAGLVALIAALPAGSARADCTTPTTNGQVVICTGSDTDAFSSNYDGLFIKVLKGASVTGPFWGINIGGDNVDIVVNGSVTDGSGPFNAIGSNGQYTNVILKNGALVQALHNNTTGIRLQGANGQVTMKDQAHVLTNGTNTVGVLVNSVDDAKIALRDKSSISANGAAAAGILTSGERTQIDINDQGHISANGADAAGIWLKGNYGVVNINDDGSITANGNAVGVAIEGDANELLLNDHSRIQVDSATGNGISILGASSNGVTIGKDAVIQTTGSNTRGISIGSGSTQNSITNYGLIDSVDSAIVDSNGVAIVTNSGTIISKNAVAIKLGGGDDVLSLKTGSQIVGDVDGGAGSDSLQLGGSGTEDADFLNFEYLMVGYPVSFNAVEHWTLAGNSAFATAANLYSGLLSVNGTITTPIVNVDDIAALGGNGRIVGNVTSAGKIAPGNSVGTLTIVGAVTQNGGGFEAEFDENGVDLLTATGNVTLTNSPALNVKALGGAGGANGTIIHSDTSITGSLAAPKYEGNGAATLLQNTNDITLLAVDGTPLVASNYATLESGLDFLSTVAGQQIEHRSACLDNTCAVEGGRRLWGNAYGRFGSESADDGNLPFEYRTAGTALGGDIDIADGFTLGGALGYGNTMAKPGEGGARTDADEELLAIYGNYEAGSFFMSGFLNAGLQQFDISREVSTNGGTDTARAETDGWLAGGGVQAGMKLDFPGGWRLTPSAGALYQHQSVNGYQEKGAGEGNVSFGRQTSDALRLQAQLDVARTLPFEDVTLIPYLQLGALGQMNFGDDVPGSFANGTDFAIALQDDHSGAVILGAGMDFEFMNGVSATVGYRAEHASETDHMLRAGISVKW